MKSKNWTEAVHDWVQSYNYEIYRRQYVVRWAFFTMRNKLFLHFLTREVKYVTTLRYNEPREQSSDLICVRCSNISHCSRAYLLHAVHKITRCWRCIPFPPDTISSAVGLCLLLLIYKIAHNSLTIVELHGNFKHWGTTAARGYTILVCTILLGILQIA